MSKRRSARALFQQLEPRQLLSAYLETGGQVVMEAEHYDATALNNDPNSNAWFNASTFAGASGTYQTTTAGGTNGSWPAGSEMSYQIEFSTAGTYKVWVRRWCADSASNSAFAGLDGLQLSGYDNNGTNYNSWYWVNFGQVSVSQGEHTFQIRRREGGYAVDRVILTTNAGYTPSGTGPAESERGYVPPDTTAPAAISDLSIANRTTLSIALNWTAPGDDGTTGTARTYDVRYSTSPISEANWSSATQVSGEPTPGSAGSSQSLTINGLSQGTTYYFAIKTADEVPNWSAISNALSGSTLSDNTAPGAITNLAIGNRAWDSVTLSWTAPGDDGSTGTAQVYDIRYSTSPITSANWASATQVSNEPSPRPAGSSESFTVTGLIPSTSYYFAVKAADEVGNWSGVSNSPSGTTLAQPLTNLLVNPSWETGTLSNWSRDPYNSTVSVVTDPKHDGSYALKIDGTYASALQGVPTIPGVDYKINAWIKLDVQTGSDWGGFVVDITDSDGTFKRSGYLSQSTYGSDWFQLGMSFTARKTTTNLKFGNFMGGNKYMTVYVDDAKFFQKPVVNTLPIIDSLSLTPTNFTSVGGTQTFSVLANDPDGAVERYVWNFGDGAMAFGPSGSRRISQVGTYTATVYVIDDDGGITTQTVTWTSTDPSYPTLSAAATPGQTSNSSIVLSGAAGGASSIKISSDRNKNQIVTASGTSNWSATVPLAPGINRLTIQAVNASGKITTTERVIRYEPSGALGFANITHPASTERWDAIEIGFDLNNSAATHPQFPFDPTPVQGLEWIDGTSVDGVFWNAVDPTKLYRRPALLVQNYDRMQKSAAGTDEWLNPNGAPKWVVRFAPPTLGIWQYRLEVAEARGTAQSAVGTFAATRVTDPNNHGPILVSPDNPTAFVYADGTPYLGNGHGGGYGSTWDADSQMAAIGQGNQSLFRWWISGYNWSSAWDGWRSMTIGYDGNVPYTGRTIESVYGSGSASLKLDLSNPIMEQSWGTGEASVLPGHTYKIRIRWRYENVTGPADASYSQWGVAVKSFGWTSASAPVKLPNAPILVAHEKGDSPWHVSEGTYTVPSGKYTLPLGIVLENVTGGTVYVDEIGVYEDVGGGQLGQNILRTPKMNAIQDFDPRGDFVLDYVLKRAENYNMAYKLVIEEKQEWLLNHLGSDGLPDPIGGNFDRGPGTPGYQLQEYYWRHLSALLGAYRSVHSWELANEVDPGATSHIRNTNGLAVFSAADGNPHLASTSTWSTLATSLWNDASASDVPYTDFHVYVPGTAFIGDSTQQAAHAKDIAQLFYDYNQAVESAGFGKPTINGEIGLGSPYLAQTDNDTAGIWLHKLTWARASSPDSFIPLYWYTGNIFAKNLHHIYGEFGRFMADVPFTSGTYVDAAATSSNGNVRAWGQKDLTSKEAFLWIDNKTHTWYNVVNSPSSISSQSSTITLNMGVPNGKFAAAWWNTYTGQMSSTQVLTANSSGVVTLSVSGLSTDTAVKLKPLPMTVSGFGGIDSFILKLDSTHTKLELTQNGILSWSVALSQIPGVTINGGDGDDTLLIDGSNGNPIPAGGIVFNGQGGSDTLSLTNGASLTIGSDWGLGTELTINVTNSNLTLNASQHLSDLSITGGSVVMGANGGRMLVSESLSIGTGGSLNLKDNDLLIGTGSVNSVREWIKSGKLFSDHVISGKDTALGYAGGDDGNVDVSKTSFAGESVDDDSVLVKFTYRGDSDLDGDVDASDVAKWAVNFTGELSGAGTRVWSQGDWDYDGDVDASDVAKWAVNFTGELSGGGLTPSQPVEPAVAEPTASEPVTSDAPVIEPAMDDPVLSEPTVVEIELATETVLPSGGDPAKSEAEVMSPVTVLPAAAPDPVVAATPERVNAGPGEAINSSSGPVLVRRLEIANSRAAEKVSPFFAEPVDLLEAPGQKVWQSTRRRGAW